MGIKYKCRNCESMAVEGRVRCATHLRQVADAVRDNRKRHKSSLLCLYSGCGERSIPKSSYCENHLPQHKKRCREWRGRLRASVLAAYGGAICACCGVTEDAFLSLDHIHGGGFKHRQVEDVKRAGLYRWLKNNNFPPGYRVLCMNCNHAIGIKGHCPHNPETIKREIE